MTAPDLAPPSAPPAQPGPAAPPRPPNLSLQVVGTALTIVAVLAVGLIAHLTAVSWLQYQRDQQTLFADFRAELKLGTAPVGQYRVSYDANGAPLPEQLVAPGSPVAVLRIPSIGMNSVVVVEGTSGDVLRAGPGHRRDTVLPGQRGTSVLMGRQSAYGAPFRDLSTKLIPGDPVYATTGQGESEYRVAGLRRPGEPEPKPLVPGAGRLTLITAHGRAFDPDGVVYVDADLISPAKPTPARRFGESSLPAAERVMGVDSTGWIWAMLWGQGLLLGAVAVTWLRTRMSGWHAWIVGVPVLAFLGLAVADQAARLLPNLL
ncbi:LPXTG-site transpeptidase (sortase) family protein [Asanoa ferruginea]|uniref:LPXTG-site transpeptidase (Sortase) family protein n=1 Tax=Asanoa ferruginea TaxID=53367 RepID=A0A3D9ZJ07_9ACTN|nr:class E sortase [Asanoa ferruginea]REF97368.1 LPXTG-site transpeptidase (sortase) family protein [Asanoa ferruginea]GIF51167.1 sortase [Asanoa ferruginea]